jgi:hypothetical protein
MKKFEKVSKELKKEVKGGVSASYCKKTFKGGKPGFSGVGCAYTACMWNAR